HAASACALVLQRGTAAGRQLGARLYREDAGMSVKRRDFLAGVGVAVGSVPLSSVAAAAPHTGAAAKADAAPQRAIHQDQPYVSNDGTGVAWDAPRGNQSTRDYLNTLTQEEF